MLTNKEVVKYAESKGFRKAIKVAPVYVRDLPEGSVCVRTREGLEKVLVESEGSLVLCRGVNNNDLWIQKRTKLEKNYKSGEYRNMDDYGKEIVYEFEVNGNRIRRNGGTRYTPKPVVRMVCIIDEPFEVMTSWSEEPLRGEAGDLLVKAGENDYYPLGRKEFDKTYRFIE